MWQVFLTLSFAMKERWAALYNNPWYLLTRHCGKHRSRSLAMTSLMRQRRRRFVDTVKAHRHACYCEFHKWTPTRKPRPSSLSSHICIGKSEEANENRGEGRAAGRDEGRGDQRQAGDGFPVRINEEEEGSCLINEPPQCLSVRRSVRCQHLPSQHK